MEKVTINGKEYQLDVDKCKEHCDACNKDLRIGHDVSRLFIGGAFGELK